MDRIRVGEFEFDCRAGELFRGGKRIRLQELPLRLLALLLEQPGSVLDREQLQRSLWPDTGFLDFEDGLNTAIRKLRRALRDDPAHPRYIETVRNRGYRLLAPVLAASLPAPPPAAAVPAGPAAAADAPSPLPSAFPGAGAAAAPVQVAASISSSFTAPAWRRPGIRLFSALLVAFLGFTLWWTTPLPPPRLLRIVRITRSGRIDTPWQLTSDGDRIYFMERFGDHWQLTQTSLHGGGSMPVASPFRNTLILDVSPDRRMFLVGSFIRRGEEMPLWRIPLQGGPPQRLGRIVAADAAYAHNGRWLAYCHRQSLWLANPDGAHPRRLIRLPGIPGAIAWSPHDRRLRFSLYHPLRGHNELWQIRRDGSHLQALLPGSRANACCGNWTPDGRYFLYTSGAGGENNLWALRSRRWQWRRAPRGPFQLTFGPKSAYGTLIASQGRRVYFLGGAHRDELVEWHLRRRLYTPFLPTLYPAEPGFAPRTGRLAYLDRAGRLWRSRADGHHRRLLLDAPALRLSVNFPRWSPDGQQLAFTGQYAGQPAQVYLLDSRGGAPRPLAPGWTDARDGDWSPGGHRIVFSYIPRPAAANRPRRLAIANLQSHRIAPLAGSRGLFLPRWSPGGQYLAAVHGRGRRLKIYSFAARQWRVAARGHLLSLPVWSPHGRYLYFQDLLAPGEPLFRLAAGSHSPPLQVAGFTALLQSGIMRCALFGLTPAGRPLLSLTTSNTNIYAADLKLP